MWKSTIILAIAVLISAMAANALLVGETNPPLNRPEVITSGGSYGANVNIDTLTGNGTVVVASFGYRTWPYCNDEIEDFVDYVYPQYTSNEFRYLEVDCWDSAYIIGQWKFVTQNNCPLTFLDGESSDWTAWHENGQTGVPQSWVIGPNGYCYYKGYGYGGNYQAYIDAIDRTVDGPGSDTEGPYTYYMFPGDGDTGKNPNTDIKGRITDDGFGVDIGTATFEVTYDGSGGPIDGTLTVESGSHFLDYKMVFDPDDPLPEYTEITVYVSSEDLVGNFGDDEWSFTTGASSGIETVSLGELKATFK